MVVYLAHHLRDQWEVHASSVSCTCFVDVHELEAWPSHIRSQLDFNLATSSSFQASLLQFYFHEHRIDQCVPTHHHQTFLNRAVTRTSGFSPRHHSCHQGTRAVITL